MNNNSLTPETPSLQSSLPYTHCLNCGTELNGMFCHNCGQEAVPKIPTVKNFIFEYVINAFIWDSKFLPTFWNLIRRPGHLTREYNSGKFTSYEHPLKLNMFLLFVFVTLFFFFASDDKLAGSLQTLTSDERVFSSVQMQTLVDNPEYAKRMEESPRDTVLLQAPLGLADEYSEFISSVETKEVAEEDSVDKWVAVLPQVLIEDEYIVIDENGYYHFNLEKKLENEGLELLHLVWGEMVRITSHYFPMLLLLTVPFLSFSLRLVNLRIKIPGIHHLIFSLHYTAFLETLIICIYILHLTINPPMEVMEYVLLISTCLYLAIAYYRVYPSSWFMAIVKSLLTSIIYLTILLFILIVMCFIACCVAVVNMA